NRYSLEFIEPAFMRCPFFVKKLAQDRDTFFEPSDALGVLDAHDFMFQRLRRALLIRSAQTHREPRAAAGDHVKTRPLLREQGRMALRKRCHTANGKLYLRCDCRQSG